MRKLGDRTWLVYDDLIFYSERYRGHVVVCSGTQTNLASIPRIAWTILPPVGRYDPAAVVHDAGYSNSLTTLDGRRIYTVKAVADNLFYEAMRASDVGAFTARLMYSAVKMFGDPEGHPLAENAKRDYPRDYRLMVGDALPG